MMQHARDAPPTLQEQLLAIPSWPSDLAALALTPKQIDTELKALEDFLVGQCSQLTLSSPQFHRTAALLGCYASLERPAKTKLLHAVVSGHVAFAKLLASASASASSLEAILVLLYACVAAGERDRTASVSAPASAHPVEPKKAKTEHADWMHLKVAIVAGIKSLVASPRLAPIHNTSADLEQTVSVLVKTTHLLLENADTLRNSSVRGAALDLLAICAARHGYTAGLRTVILQDLNYLEHLAEFNADLVAQISVAHQDPSLLDEILQHLGAVKLAPEDSGPVKIISLFLLRLVRQDPKGLLRNIAPIADHLDSESYSMRMAMLEVFAALIVHLTEQDRSDQVKSQTSSFLAALEERLRDVNSFVRSKVLHLLSDLVHKGALPISSRVRLVDLVIGRTIDKSSNVRRRAIQLLGDFIRTHPFCVDGGELSLSLFEERLREVVLHLDQLAPASIRETMAGSFDEMPVLGGAEDAASPQALHTILLQKRYYSDAIAFVRQLDAVIPTLSRLLSSTTKTEVFEAMDFFVDAHTYKLHSSEIGIRRMMHLIWDRDLSTEDGSKRSVKEHVLSSYKRVLLDVDTRLAGREKHQAIATNLLSLVRASSLSDLASVEQLVTEFSKRGWIPDGVVQILGSTFASKTSTAPDRRASLILITTVGRSRPEVVQSRIEPILRFGFDSSVLPDCCVAEYACIAVRLLAPPTEEGSVRLPNDNLVLARLASLIAAAPASYSWLQVAGQAIKSIYLLADQPSLLASALLKESSHGLLDGAKGGIPSSSLTKLLFLAGHVAVCEVGHLENIERDWKLSRARKPAGSKSDMDGVLSTAEDDVADAVRYVRERELLYGPDSLLAVFGQLAASICADDDLCQDAMLRNVASMTLAKFMTVSERYCEEHLALFLKLLGGSGDPLVRGNLTIAFADLAQVFGHIVDENIVHLFHRLRDTDVPVKRKTLMVLTHLTLTGMIKVKGQIGEIAKCILDRDQRIADLARLFFHELAGKDNTVYNHIPDIISSLSVAADAEEHSPSAVSEEDFQRIARFVFDFVKKERQMEGLVEKLCQRFRQCSTARQTRDLAFCLTLINYTSDRTIRRLVDSFTLYKDRLIDEAVFRSFAEVLQKLRKGAKAELRGFLDEFEQKILQAVGEATGSGGDIVSRLKHLSLQAGAAQKKKTKARPRVASRRADAFEEEENDDDDEGHEGDSDGEIDIGADGNDEIVSGGEDVQKIATRKPAKARSARPARRTASRAIAGDDGGDGDEDETFYRQ